MTKNHDAIGKVVSVIVAICMLETGIFQKVKLVLIIVTVFWKTRLYVNFLGSFWVLLFLVPKTSQFFKYFSDYVTNPKMTF